MQFLITSESAVSLEYFASIFVLMALAGLMFGLIRYPRSSAYPTLFSGLIVFTIVSVLLWVGISLNLNWIGWDEPFQSTFHYALLYFIGSYIGVVMSVSICAFIKVLTQSSKK